MLISHVVDRIMYIKEIDTVHVYKSAKCYFWGEVRTKPPLCVGVYLQICLYHKNNVHTASNASEALFSKTGPSAESASEKRGLSVKYV